MEFYKEIDLNKEKKAPKTRSHTYAQIHYNKSNGI